MNQKPNWNDAPEWANWLALNDIEKWTWFEDKPKLNISGYEPTGRYITHNKWKQLKSGLEKRPK